MNEQTNELAVTDEPVEISAAIDTTDDGSHDVPQVPEQFSIKDAAAASWLLRKINDARRHAKRAADWASREIKRAERDEEFLMFRFGRQLEDWASKEIDRLRNRRRSVNLPGGTAGYRKVGATLVIDNPEVVLAWAKKSCPKAVVVTERLTKTPIYEHFEETGEMPEGAHIEESRDRFYVS